MVTEHHCSRVVKEATVLRKLGYEVSVITMFVRDVSLYSSFSLYSTAEQFYSTIKDVKADIFHVHNEPHWMLYAVRETFPKAKILLDYHDSNYWRNPFTKVEKTSEPITWYNEDVVVECADAYVVPSWECKRETRTRVRKKPIVVVPAAVPLDWYITRPIDFWGGLVINGGVTANPANRLELWRDYTKIVKELTVDFDVYIFSSSWKSNAGDSLHNTYYELGAHCGKLTPQQLLKRLAEHTWNLVGNYVLDEEGSYVWKYSLPNKFFEAVAAGIPTVVFNCPEVAKIVERYDIGIVIQDPKELKKRWAEHSAKRKNLYMVRRKLCMENYIKPLLGLYDEM
jgi:hypothetical protein